MRLRRWLRTLVIVAVTAVFLASCFDPGNVMSGTETDAGSTTTRVTTTAIVRDVTGSIDRGDVSDDFALGAIEVSSRPWVVAVASDSANRNRGLRGVADLGDLDGMLFVFPNDANSTFGMLTVPITLEIAWFAADGSLVDRTTMAPCAEEPCASYSARGPYRYALETLPGRFDGLEPLTLSPQIAPDRSPRRARRCR